MIMTIHGLHKTQGDNRKKWAEFHPPTVLPVNRRSNTQCLVLATIGQLMATLYEPPLIYFLLSATDRI